MGEKKKTAATVTKDAVNTEKRGKKRKKPAKKSKSADDLDLDLDLDLDEVLELGGTKEDFELLREINDGEGGNKESKKEKEIGEGVIQSLVKSLGFKTSTVKKQHSAKELPDNFNYGEMMPDNAGSKNSKKNAKKGGKKKENEKGGKKEESKQETIPVENKSIEPPKPKPAKKKSKNKYRPQPESADEDTPKESGNTEIQNSEVSSTTDSSKKQKQKQKKTPKERKKPDGLIIKAGNSWFTMLEEIESNQSAAIPPTANWTSVKSLESEAAQLFQKDVEKYREERNKSKKSETEWYEKIVTQGTLSDRQAALQLFIAESPVHNLASLDSLILMSKKKGRRECITAAEAIKDVLIKNILPKDRQLNAFSTHKMHELQENKRERQLLLWHFEGELKRRVGVYVESLVAMLQDNVDAPKEKALAIISGILAHTTEEQSILLNILVNKVGDPNYKIASKTVYILTKLIKICPDKKSPIIDEIEKLICRPNMQQKALYYSFCFLSNIRLKEGESKLAERLIKIYFSFFQRFIKQGELDNRMLSVLLAGVNFAFPIVHENREFIQEQMDTLHKIIHLVNFNTSLQILMLLYQIMDTNDNLSDRFYMVLYKKMCDPALKNSNRQVHFLNLLFRSIKKDYSKARVKAFVKRLLQMCCYQSPPFVCASLCLLSEVYREKPDLINLKNISENFEDGDEHFKDVDPDSDKEEGEEKAEGEEEIKETIEKQKVYDSGSDSEEETESKTSTAEPQEKEAVSSWIHRKNLQTVPLETTYVPSHRNPLYCRAETTPLWELQRLSFHYHPTVSLYASTLLSGKFVEFDGDPLQDYTLMRFLDRFVFKNPKKIEKQTDASVPKKRQYQPTGIKLVPANSSKYLEDETSIPVEEKYLYRYFAQKDAANRKKGIFSDDEEVDDDEFDEFIENNEGTTKDYELNDFDFYHELSKQTGKDPQEEFSSESEAGEDPEESDEEVDFGSDFMSQFKELDDDDDGGNMEEGGDDDDDDGGDEDDFDNDLMSQFKELDDGDGDDEMMEGDDDDDDMMKGDDDLEGGFNEEDIRFSDSDSDGNADVSPQIEAALASKKKKLKRSIEDSKDNRADVSKLFMAAEEFSTMLDEGNSEKALGSSALVNRDKAAAKQLKWEVERENWMKGMNWKSKKHKPGGNWKKKKAGSSSKMAGGGISKKPGGGISKKHKQKGKKKGQKKMKKK